VREVVKEEVAQSMSHYKVPKSMQVAAAPAAVLPQKSRRNSAADHEPAVPHSHHAPQSVSHAPKHVPAPEPKFDEDWSDNETIEDIVGPTYAYHAPFTICHAHPLTAIPLVAGLEYGQDALPEIPSLRSSKPLHSVLKI
jgi:hypothetical protein